MLPLALVADIEKLLTQISGKSAIISATHNLSGGCINQAVKVVYAGTAYFIKWNNNALLPNMFETEAAGLKLLASAGGMSTPDVLGFGQAGNYQYLLLSYVEAGPAGKQFWESFGQALAMLHKQSHSSFGLDHDNYIGSLPQHNQPAQSWSHFFQSQRIEPLAEKAISLQLIDHETAVLLDELYRQLPDMFPAEPPALLHGDLWSGNFISDHLSKVVLIDPAVYYGHREMDLAMSLLFGGFDPLFYEAYNAVYPLEKHWRQRVDLCNLYPLLVHTLLFGSGYAHQLKRNLQLLLHRQKDDK